MVYRLLHIMALNTMILKQEESTNQVTLVKYKKEVKQLNQEKMETLVWNARLSIQDSLMVSTGKVVMVTMFVCVLDH